MLERPGSGSLPSRSSSQRIREGPHDGCIRRIHSTRASIAGGI